jgi:hypothetical protein
MTKTSRPSGEQGLSCHWQQLLKRRFIYYEVTRVETDQTQSRQSAKFFSPVVGIGTSTPSPAGECAPPHFGSGGGATLASGRGVGRGSQFRRGDIVVLSFKKVGGWYGFKNVCDTILIDHVVLFPCNC